jgi:nucleoside-diphosphate-sugar epimerase
MQKRALVTGANGFFGSHMARRLVEDGFTVRGLVRPGSSTAALDGVDLEIVRGDLAEGELPADLFKGVDQVYHIAGLFRQESVPQDYFHAVNAGGTEKVLRGALDAGVERFIHCSTIGVLGDIKNPPADENTPYNPGDHYQISKVEGEKLALEYHRRHGLPVVVVRPASIYGPGDLRFLKLFKSINKRLFFIIGSGKTHLQFIYIDDLVQAARLMAENPDVLGETFIIAGDEPVTINDLAACIAGVLDRPVPKIHLPYRPLKVAAKVVQKVCVPLGIEPPLYPRRLDFFTKNREFDISKARTRLGFQPQVDLQTGLTRVAEWYREQNYL